MPDSGVREDAEDTGVPEQPEIYREAQAELEGLIPAWALSFRDEETLAKKAAEWLVEKFPDTFNHATWVSIKKPDLEDLANGGEGWKDKGLEIKIFRKEISKTKKFFLQFGGLVGLRSAGLNISAPVYTSELGVVISIGFGAVSPYDGFGKDIKPVISFSAKIPLDGIFG